MSDFFESNLNNDPNLQIEEELTELVEDYANKARVAEGQAKLASGEIRRMTKYMLSRAKNNPYTLEEVRLVNKKADKLSDNKRVLKELRDAYQWREGFVKGNEIIFTPKEVDPKSGLIVGEAPTALEARRRVEEGGKDAR